MKKSLPRQAGELVIYQTKEGGVKLRGDFSNDTLWATQAQITNIFDIDRTVISKHVKNIFDSGELNAAATVSKMETVQNEGGRDISRQVEYYNLDLIISIGYRVNSAKAMCKKCTLQIVISL